MNIQANHLITNLEQMMNNKRNILLIALLTGFLTLTACEQNDGPMESAGEKMDNAYDDTKQAVTEGMEEIKDTSEDIGDKAEDMVDKAEDKME